MVNSWIVFCLVMFAFHAFVTFVHGQLRITNPPAASATTTYNITNSADEVTLRSIGPLMGLHHNVFHFGGSYETLSQAVGASQNGLLWIGVGSHLFEKLSGLTPSQRVWDYRFGRADFYGTMTLGRNLVYVDTLQTVKNLIDTVCTRAAGGVINLGSGRYDFADSLKLHRVVALYGVPPKRVAGNVIQDSLVGSVLRFPGGSSLGIRVRARGVDLAGFTVTGSGSDGIFSSLYTGNTTLGDVTMRNVHSTLNAGNGFLWYAPDNSSMMYDCDASRNGGFGIRAGAFPGGTARGGVGLMIIGGRERRNSAGGIYLEDMSGYLVLGNGAIEDTTYGIRIGSSTTQDLCGTVIGLDAEKQVQRTGGFPATSARISADTRQGTWIGNLFGTSTGNPSTTVKRRISFGGQVRSWLGINNLMMGVGNTVADTAVVVEDNSTVNTLWIGDNGTSSAFNPLTDPVVGQGASYRAGWIALDHNNTHGRFYVKSNSEMHVGIENGKSGDTLRVFNDNGLTILEGKTIEIEPNADASLRIYKNSGPGENRLVYVYGDSGGTTKYLSFGVESDGIARFRTTGRAMVFANAPVRMAGDSRLEFVSRTGIPEVSSGNGALVVKGTSLWFKNWIGDSSDVMHTLNIGAETNVVLSASGGATVPRNGMNLILDTYGGAAYDTLTSLTGKAGDIVVIGSANSDRKIVILDSGNFSLGSERLLSHVDDRIVLLATSATKWVELSFSNNDLP